MPGRDSAATVKRRIPLSLEFTDSIDQREEYSWCNASQALQR